MKKRFLSLILVLLLLLLCSCAAKSAPEEGIPENHMTAMREMFVQLDEGAAGLLAGEPEALKAALIAGEVQLGEPIRLYKADPTNDRYEYADTTFYLLTVEGEVAYLVQVLASGGELHVSFADKDDLYRLQQLDGADCPKAFVMDAEFCYLYTAEHGFEKLYGVSPMPGWRAELKGNVEDGYSTGPIELSNALTENGKTWPVELRVSENPFIAALTAPADRAVMKMKVGNAMYSFREITGRNIIYTLQKTICNNMEGMAEDHVDKAGGIGDLLKIEFYDGEELLVTFLCLAEEYDPMHHDEYDQMAVLYIGGSGIYYNFPNGWEHLKSYWQQAPEVDEEGLTW